MFKDKLSYNEIISMDLCELESLIDAEIRYQQRREAERQKQENKAGLS